VIAVLASIVVLLGLTVTYLLGERAKMVQRLTHSEVRPGKEGNTRASTTSDSEDSKITDSPLEEAAQLLDARERNNSEIKSLLDRRDKVRKSAQDFLDYIRESDLAAEAKREKLRDPSLQFLVKRENEIEEQLEKVSLENMKLHGQWRLLKLKLPSDSDIRFSEPKFLKCSVLTDWRLDEW